MKEDSYIKGNVYKFLYESSTGYKVGLFKVKESSGDLEEYINKTITFTGNFMSLNNDLTYIFKGKMINHARFGLQFAVSSYENVVPTNIDGIISYLSSGIFKGIGEKTARVIVNTFKEETINEIKNGNPILSKLKGMSEKKAKELTKKIIEYDKDQELIIEFNKLGFTTLECLKIVNKYKSRCFDIIENNIYSLENDINFLKLDRIFLNYHSELDNIRVDALIKYSIKNMCYSTGDTLVTKENLYLEVNKYFTETLDSLVFLERLNDLIINKEVIETEEFVTLSTFYNVESDIALRVKELNNIIKTDFKEEDIDKYIEKYEKKNNIIFNDTQKRAIKGSLVSNFFIITGGPGTGKTTIIKAVVDIYEKLLPNLTEEDITLLAPTGKSSKRLNESVKKKSSTIHKFLKWNKETEEFSVNRFNPVKTKMVIIDEVSMVDIFLFNSLLEALPSKVKIILVGDANQLPSISPGNILSDLLSSSIVNHIYLTDIYRTKNDSFLIPFAVNIKDRITFDSVPSGYEDFKFFVSTDYDIKNYLKKIFEITKSKNMSIEDFQVLIPMYKGENGIDSINELMQNIFNPKSDNKEEIIIRDILYREGDKVIQLVNDVDNNIFNGDTGYIKKIISGKNPLIFIDYNGNLVAYSKSKFDEFTLSYAISVHKSQGSEYDNVVVVIPSNMRRMMYNKLIYTAVTRAKKSLILVGSLDSLNYAIKTEYSKYRNTSLKNLLV